MEKKKRGINFTAEEVKLLLKITNIYKTIIENKKTDGPTWRAKEACWNKVEREFNNYSNGPPRTSKQLKMKYEGIKKEMKKKHAEHGGCSKSDDYAIATSTSSTMEEKELSELSIHGLKSNHSANMDDTESTSSQGDCQIKVEEIICECDNFIVPDLQLPNHSDQEPSINTNIDTVHFYNENNEHSTNIRKTADDKRYETSQSKYEEQRWSRRRRSVLRRKRSQTSSVNKLEELSIKKGKLVDLLIENAEEQKNVVMKNIEKQFEAEHNLRMCILNERKKQEELQTELLRYETEIVKRKLQKLINDE